VFKLRNVREVDGGFVFVGVNNTLNTTHILVLFPQLNQNTNQLEFYNSTQGDRYNIFATVVGINMNQIKSLNDLIVGNDYIIKPLYSNIGNVMKLMDKRVDDGVVFSGFNNTLNTTYTLILLPHLLIPNILVFCTPQGCTPQGATYKIF